MSIINAKERCGTVQIWISCMLLNTSTKSVCKSTKLEENKEPLKFPNWDCKSVPYAAYIFLQGINFSLNHLFKHVY